MNGPLAAWVPPEVLVATLSLALGLLYKLVLDRAKKTEAALEKVAASIELVRGEQQAMRIAMTGFSSIEQLGRLGDRLDGRITSAEAKLAVAMDRYERTERPK